MSDLKFWSRSILFITWKEFFFAYVCQQGYPFLCRSLRVGQACTSLMPLKFCFVLNTLNTPLKIPHYVPEDVFPYLWLFSLSVKQDIQILEWIRNTLGPKYFEKNHLCYEMFWIFNFLKYLGPFGLLRGYFLSQLHTLQ